MKRILMIAAGVMFAAGAAYAADSMAGTYGNTVAAQGGKTSSKMWYKADHTYTGALADGTKISGTWDDAGGQLCVMPKDPKPPAGMEKNCGPSMAGKKAGDSWQSKGPDGTTYSVSITQGM